MRRRTLIIVIVGAVVAITAVIAAVAALRGRQASPGQVGGGQQSPPIETVIQPTQETSPLEFGEPAENDTDSDGLDNALEASLGTDATNTDTDSDGLTDNQEYFFTKTDPTKPDTDGDGVTDGTQYFRDNPRPAPR